MEFERLRKLMVKTQLASRGIKDTRVLEAMARVPRHLFCGEATNMAYEDKALPIGRGQTISQPYMVARMTELLELKGTERVLELGTGSGYQTAVLAELAKEVYTIERIAELTDGAKKVLDKLGYKNIHFLTDDGTLGWPMEAPFERILVTAAAPDVSEVLTGQLTDGGVLVVPVGERFTQTLIKAVKRDGKITQTHHTPCVFVPLIGKHGWEEGG